MLGHFGYAAHPLGGLFLFTLSLGSALAVGQIRMCHSHRILKL